MRSHQRRIELCLVAVVGLVLLQHSSWLGLLQAVVAVPVDESTLLWSVQLWSAATSQSNPLEVSLTNLSVVALDPNGTYIAEFGLINTKGERQHSVAASLRLLGLSPVLEETRLFRRSGLSLAVTEATRELIAADWLKVLTAPSSPGVYSLTVTSASHIPGLTVSSDGVSSCTDSLCSVTGTVQSSSGLPIGFGGQTVEDTRLQLRVSSATVDVVSLNAAAVLWGAVIQPPSLSAKVIAAGGTNQLRIFGHPERSATRLAVLSSSAMEVLLSDDNFVSQTMVNLSAATPLLRSTAVTTGCSSKPSGLIDVVITPARIVVATASGVVQGVRRDIAESASTTDSVVNYVQWERVLSECITMLASPTQASLELTKINDVMLAMATNPLRLWMSSNFSRPFTPLLDVQGRSLADVYATEHLWSNDTAIIRADVSTLDPTHILLLSASPAPAPSGSVSSSNFTLYAYDFVEQVADQFSQFMWGYSSVNEGAWSTVFRFPKRIAAYEPPSNQLVTRSSRDVAVQSRDVEMELERLGLAASLNFELKILGMTLSRKHGSDVIVWGNALLLSADAGRSFAVCRTFASTTVLQVTTAKDGGFVALTADRTLWYGRVGVVTLVRVAFPVLASSSFPVHPLATSAFTSEAASRAFFDIFFTASDQLLIAAVLNGTEGTYAQVFRTASDAMTQHMKEALATDTQVAASLCPFANYKIDAVNNVTVTRSLSVTSSGAPSSVFLDYAEGYSMRVVVDAASHVKARDLGLSAVSLGANTVDISSFREQVRGEYGGTAVFAVSITDLKKGRAQAPSGQNLTLTTLRLQFFNDSLGCAAPGTPQWTVSTAVSSANRTVRGVVDGALQPEAALQTSRVMASAAFRELGTASFVDVDVYTGCPPDQRLEFDARRSRDQFEGCDVLSDGVVCFSYNYDLIPTLLLVDDVAKTTEDYNKPFLTEIIAGGEELHSIRYFDEEEMKQFNQGDKSIWTSLDVVDGNVIQPGGSISWVCGVGSPCGNVIPTWPDAPQFYLLMRFTSAGAFAESYCAHTVEVLVRLHGLPLDYITLSYVVLTVIAAILLLAIVLYWRSRDRYVAFAREVSSMEDSDEDDSDEEVIVKETEATRQMTQRNLMAATSPTSIWSPISKTTVDNKATNSSHAPDGAAARSAEMEKPLLEDEEDDDGNDDDEQDEEEERKQGRDKTAKRRENNDDEDESSARKSQNPLLIPGYIESETRRRGNTP